MHEIPRLRTWSVYEVGPLRPQGGLGSGQESFPAVAGPHTCWSYPEGQCAPSP